MHGLFKKFHWNQSDYNEGKGANLLQQMQSDEYNAHHEESANVYLPFNKKKEWQLVEWFGRSSLSQAQINSFLWLDIVCTAILTLSRLTPLICTV